MRELYRHEDYIPCSNLAPLSYIVKENNGHTVILKINRSLTSQYTLFKVHCCYSKVTRLVTLKRPDDSISFSKCIPFEDSVEIVDPIIKVTCKDSFSFEIYSNVHASISPIHIPYSDIKTSKMTAKVKTTFSILFIGMDSMSKLNLIRTMPKTFNFLEKNSINLKGYTKVGLNTLPNLMGILTGLTIDQLKKWCDYQNKINDCPNIWNQFKEMGYITAYGEDSSDIGSFNYAKKGFSKPPTDFYFRPYFLASETLKIIQRERMYYCTGPETEGERIMNLVKDFQITLKNYSKFALFWMNSFTHDDLNIPSAMDEKMENFLIDIYKHLDNTILFFFSDHGFRFNDITKRQTGWLEEKMPIFYVSFPDSFKKIHPKAYYNFQINSGRLTSSYDIYMTLQNILRLADRSYSLKKSLACAKCHSLFRKVSERRSCQDAGISKDYCVCNITQTYEEPQEITKEPAKFLLDEINKLVRSYRQRYKCHVYKLDRITLFEKCDFKNEYKQTRTNLLLRIQTQPKAVFEALLEIVPNKHNSSDFRLLGDIIRMNRYSMYSSCIQDSSLEKYCYCKEQKPKTISDKIKEFLFD
ncbi:DUF229 domain containing protein [Asbolus verrucosus]|uniref:DUF229 domain containing protein n=1 Tax=Asbolus verrucosus TaxID=1661398 RepID=A0A482W6P5_ASBVE|nr:DUF229 domain containing protein [Asbolus verrucosus]